MTIKQVSLRLTETAAVKQSDIIKLLLSKIGCPAPSKILSLGGGTWVVSYKKSPFFRLDKEGKELLRFIKANTNPGYFSPASSKQLGVLYVSCQLTSKTSLDIEMLPNWGVVLVNFSYGMAEGPYLMDALQG